MNKLNSTIAKIEQQQGTKRGTVWMVGEQLKEILRNEPQLAELVDADLENKEQSLAAVEKKIRQFAMGNGGAASGEEAEEIIRKVYGLPKRGTGNISTTCAPTISLEDFF